MTSSVVETRINRNSPDFEKNTRRMVDLLTAIKNQKTTIQQGGGAKAIESQHKKGRMVAIENRRTKSARAYVYLPRARPNDKRDY